MTGRVPERRRAAAGRRRASRATLAWPAPADRDEAIDALEHDLSTLRALDDEPDASARGRAHYILQLNESLQRSVRERFMRAKRGWSHWDGIVAATERLKPILAAQRLGARRVLAVGLAEVRRLSVPVPVERDLPYPAGGRSRAARSGSIR